jgi:hypothetical protein
MPIDWAAENFIALKILQPVSVVGKYFKDLERPEPECVKFTVLALLLSGRIPLYHQVTRLEFFLLFFLVKSLLDLLLTVVSSVQDLLSDLLCLHHLMNSPEYKIRLPFIVMEKIYHR